MERKERLIKERNYTMILAEKNRKPVKQRPPFDYKQYENGNRWFDSGLSLEDAPEELRENVSFVDGYEHGRRLALIDEMKAKDNDKKK